MKKILFTLCILVLAMCMFACLCLPAFAAEASEPPADTQAPVYTAEPSATPETTPAPEPSGGDTPSLDPGDIGTCTAITIICFLIGMAVKASPLDNKWVPIIVGAAGGIIGALALWLMPGFPAKDIISAIGVGVLSGLAAVGVHQIGKQLSGNT